MARKRIQQVAAIPLRVNDGQLEALLITSSRGDWIVPKGHIDPGHTPRQMAAIEALEEAGVVGEPLDPPLGTFRIMRRSAECHVITFALRVQRVLSTWEESHRRDRMWLPVADAAQTVALHGLRKILVRISEGPDRIRPIEKSGKIRAVRRTA